MKLMQWISKMAYLNILWMLFTLIGFGVLGFFPATITMFKLIRDWTRDTQSEWSFSLFYESFKKEFFKGNIIGSIIFILSFLSYFNFQIIIQEHSGIFQMIKIPLFILIVIVVLSMLYVIPIYVHYQVSIKEVFKFAFSLMIIHPLYNIGMIVSLISLLLLMFFLPNSLLLFLGSATSYIIMKICLVIFEDLDTKIQKEYSN